MRLSKIEKTMGYVYVMETLHCSSVVCFGNYSSRGSVFDLSVLFEMTFNDKIYTYLLFGDNELMLLSEEQVNDITEGAWTSMVGTPLEGFPDPMLSCLQEAMKYVTGLADPVFTGIACIQVHEKETV
jgi:hypothetical protein